MKKNSLSVLIPDGESSLALPVLHCLAHHKDLRVNVLSTEPHSLIRFSKYRQDYIIQPLHGSNQNRAEAIYNAVRKTNADIVLPVDQPTIHLLAINNAIVPLPTKIVPIPSSEAFEVVADKWLFAQFLARKNISSPATILYQESSNIDQDISALHFPVLIKPTHGAGGRGIKFFDNLSDLKQYLEKQPDMENLVVQSFIRGYDIDCSVLCKDGDILAYTIQKGFVSHSDPFGPPAGVEFLYDEQVYDIVVRLMRALKWSGVAHIDLRYDEESAQPKIIEINPRFWGSLVGSLIAGVNFPYLACLATWQDDFSKPEYQFKKYVNMKARLGLLKQRFLQGHTTIDPWIGETGFNLVAKDPLPEIYKLLSRRKGN